MAGKGTKRTASPDPVVQALDDLKRLLILQLVTPGVEAKDIAVALGTSKSTWRTMNRRHLVLLTLIALASFGCSREIYLSCSLVGPSGQRYLYSFAFDEEKGTLFWVEGGQKFKILRNTSTQLWAEHGMKFRDFPHDQTGCRLNRVTGVAEIYYLRKPSPDQIASCKKAHNWGCEDPLVLTEKSESGTCDLTDRAIK